MLFCTCIVAAAQEQQAVGVVHAGIASVAVERLKIVRIGQVGWYGYSAGP